VLEVQSKGLLQGRPGGGVRGEIAYWSQDSRRRLLRRLSEFEWGRMGKLVMVTLTYPGEFSTDGAVWKRDLQAFRKRWTRAFGQPMGIWKLEFQSRGAAHFHIVVGFDGSVEDLRPVVAAWWFSIVGSGDDRHLFAGTEVSWFRKRQRVSWYLGGYIGKRHKLAQNVKPENVTGVGRWWGYWGLKRPRGLVQELTAAEFAAVRGALGAQRAGRVAETGVWRLLVDDSKVWRGLQDLKEGEEMRCTLEGTFLTMVEDTSRSGYVSHKALVMVDREPVMVEMTQRQAQEWEFGDGEAVSLQVRAEVQFGRLTVRYFPPLPREDDSAAD